MTFAHLSISDLIWAWNCSGELIDVYPGWPDAGVAGGVGGDQREATIVGAQHGVRVGLVTAECADRTQRQRRQCDGVALVDRRERRQQLQHLSRNLAQR